MFLIFGGCDWTPSVTINCDTVGHSLALKLRVACFRLLIVEHGNLQIAWFASINHILQKNKTPQNGVFLIFGGCDWTRTNDLFDVNEAL